MVLIFCNLSGCEQLVRCPTPIAGSRLNLVMMDVPDIVDVFAGTPLGTSDNCFVNCVLQLEQFELEYNIRGIVFLKHQVSNWDNIRCAVRNFTYSTIIASC